jgi:hypothetical protein
MATKKTKKHKPKHSFRNAAPPSRTSNARPSNARPSTGARPRAMGLGDDTAGWRAIKTAGGAVGAALACAFIARQDWLPPKAITGAVSAVGATLAVGGHSDTLRTIGLGAMSAAGAQLGLMLIDDHYQGDPTPNATPPAKKPANAQELPPGALEAAYERARARLAMAQASDEAA